MIMRKVNVLTSYNDKKNILNDVHQLLKNSYENVKGGFLYTPEDLINKSATSWNIVMENDTIISVVIHRNTRFGKKITLVGCNKTDLGKRALLTFLLECLRNKEENYWCEASEAIEHWLVKHGFKPYSNKLAYDLLELNMSNNFIEKCDDGAHYVRNIKGTKKVKAIYGNVKL